MAVKYLSAGCWPTGLSVDVGRYADQVSAGTSAKYQLTDTRSTDALSTHDPSKFKS